VDWGADILARANGKTESGTIQLERLFILKAKIS
jgi:hypothetical protein